MQSRLGWLSIALIALASCAAAQIESYRVAPGSDSKFELIVTKTGFLSGKKHIFAFPQYSGELKYDAKVPENSTVTLRIDAASVQCNDDWVSEDDRKKVLNEATGKMLIIEKHPTLTFQSTSIRRLADGTFVVAGQLTIRSTPKPASVTVTMAPSSDGRLRFAGQSTIDMTSWGLKPPKALLGAIGTEKEMLVRFDVLAKM